MGGAREKVDEAETRRRSRSGCNRFAVWLFATQNGNSGPRSSNDTEGRPKRMGCVFVVFFWFPGGLEATKGPHSDARAYEAHHAAAGAAHCTARDNKTDADRRHERQRPSTHTHTHACATMCVTPRGRPPTDDSGERHPNGHESTRAQIMQATPPRDNQARRRTTQSTPPKVRSPASAEHTHTHAKIEQTPTHHGKKRRPKQRRARRQHRARPSLLRRRGAAFSSRRRDR